MGNNIIYLTTSSYIKSFHMPFRLLLLWVKQSGTIIYLFKAPAVIPAMVDFKPSATY